MRVAAKRPRIPHQRNSPPCADKFTKGKGGPKAAPSPAGRSRPRARVGGAVRSANSGRKSGRAIFRAEPLDQRIAAALGRPTGAAGGRVRRGFLETLGGLPGLNTAVCLRAVRTARRPPT